MTKHDLTWKKSAVLYIIGYVIAVMVSVAVVVLLITIPTMLPDNGALGSFYKQLDLLGAMFVFGLVYTGASALPGYIITLILVHRFNSHGRWFYVLAGIATAALAHILFGLFVGFFLVDEKFVFAASLPGGAAGAYAYFLWREKMLSVWGR